MSKVFDFSDVNTFCPNSKDSNLSFTLGSQVNMHFLQRKRSRISAPFIVGKISKQQPSIEALPDECLFEILRRLPGGRERNACACVSRRWLMLLSSIKKDETCTSETTRFLGPEIQSNPPERDNSAEPKEDDDFSRGYLSRCLEGKKATDVRLAAIAVGTANRGGLGKLSIRGSNETCGPTNLGLKAISRGCPSLRALSLWDVSSVSDEGLCEIASACHSLEDIQLFHCSNITDKGLVAIAKNCPNLTSVAVESCSNIGNESLQALGSYYPNLKFVSIKNCPLVGDKGIASLFSSAGHVLTRAKLQNLNISDVSLAVIGHHGTAMIDLTLVGLQNVNEKGFWLMGKGRGLRKLKSLTVTSCPGVSDLGLGSLGKGCPDIKTLALRKCPHVSDNGVVSFARAAESLESLRLEECHVITQRGVFGILANCGKKLKAIALVNCMGNRDLGFRFPLTSLCRSLRSLTIRNCPGFGDAGLGGLGKICPNLTHVDLSGNKEITDACILPLVENSEDGLVEVNLSGCAKLTDNTVTVIAKLHGDTLDLLKLDGCRCITDASLIEIASNCMVLSELDVSRCGITDSGIKVLAEAVQMSLLTFSIAGCSLVSDESLPFLVELGKTMVGLNVQYCGGITSGTVDLLVDQLWRCDILS
ncbi:hypothetical protein ABFS83_05G144900 [Erythranthe nasuta]